MREKRFWQVVGALLGIALIILFTSCSPTITRPEVHQSQASHTSTGQDSGILSEKSTAPTVGFIVNQDWLNGYDSLLLNYGRLLSPPRKAGDRDGIAAEGKYFRITDAVMERQLVLNQRRVNDQSP